MTVCTAALYFVLICKVWDLVSRAFNFLNPVSC